MAGDDILDDFKKLNKSAPAVKELASDDILSEFEGLKKKEPTVLESPLQNDTLSSPTSSSNPMGDLSLPVQEEIKLPDNFQPITPARKEKPYGGINIVSPKPNVMIMGDDSKKLTAHAASAKGDYDFSNQILNTIQDDSDGYAYELKAHNQMAAGNTKEAKQNLIQAIDLNPNNARLYSQLALVAQKDGDNKTAVEAADRHIKEVGGANGDENIALQLSTDYAIKGNKERSDYYAKNAEQIKEFKAQQAYLPTLSKLGDYLVTESPFYKLTMGGVQSIEAGVNTLKSAITGKETINEPIEGGYEKKVKSLTPFERVITGFMGLWEVGMGVGMYTPAGYGLDAVRATTALGKVGLGAAKFIVPSMAEFNAALVAGSYVMPTDIYKWVTAPVSSGLEQIGVDPAQLSKLGQLGVQLGDMAGLVLASKAAKVAAGKIPMPKEQVPDYLKRAQEAYDKMRNKEPLTTEEAKVVYDAVEQMTPEDLSEASTMVSVYSRAEETKAKLKDFQDKTPEPTYRVNNELFKSSDEVVAKVDELKKSGVSPENIEVDVRNDPKADVKLQEIVAPEVKKPDISGVKEITDILNRRETDPGYAFSDMVNDIDATERFPEAVAEYRKAQEYDRSVKGRGDMDQAEKAFEDAVSQIGKPKDNINPKQNSGLTDLSKMSDDEVVQALVSEKDPQKFKELSQESFKRKQAAKNKPADNQQHPFPQSTEKDVFFHGTPHGEFNEFDISKRGDGADSKGFGDYGNGFYFTKDKKTAQEYADGLVGEKVGNKPYVMQVHLDIKNPFDLSKLSTYHRAQNRIARERGNMLKMTDADFEQARKEAGLSEKELELMEEIEGTIGDNWGDFNVAKQLKEQGYDAIISHDKSEYVVFDKEQIKKTPSPATEKAAEVPTFDQFKAQQTDGRFTTVGSRIRGEEKPTSDYDIMTVLTPAEKGMIPKNWESSASWLPKDILDKFKEMRGSNGKEKKGDVIVIMPVESGHLSYIISGTPSKPRMTRVGNELSIGMGFPKDTKERGILPKDWTPEQTLKYHYDKRYPSPAQEVAEVPIQPPHAPVVAAEPTFITPTGEQIFHDGNVIRVTKDGKDIPPRLDRVRKGKEVYDKKQKKLVKQPDKGYTVPNPEYQKAVNEYANSVDLDKGESAFKEGEQYPADLDQVKHITENSTSPREIAEAYISERDVPTKATEGSATDEAINKHMKPVIGGEKDNSPGSFRAVMAKANITPGMRMNWFRKDGAKLDQLALDASGEFKDETSVTPEMVADFIVRYPNNGDYARAHRNTNIEALKERFEHVTGMPLDNAMVNRVRNEQLNKLAEQRELTPDQKKQSHQIAPELLDIIESQGIDINNIEQFKDNSFIFDPGEYEKVKQYLENQVPAPKTGARDEIPIGPEGKGEGMGDLQREASDRIAEIDRELEQIVVDRKKESDRVDKANANIELPIEVAKKGELIGAEQNPLKDKLTEFDKQTADLTNERQQLVDSMDERIVGDQAQGDLFNDNEVGGSGEEFAKRQPKSKETGIGKSEPKKTESQPKGAKAKDWIEEDKMTNEKLGGIEFPELVALAKELTGNTPIIRHLGRALGKFSHTEGGTSRIKLTRELFKFGNEKQLGKVIAHEIGHLFDWLPDKTLNRGNLLGRLASLKDYYKTLLKESPGVKDNILTPKDRAALRRQAEKELKEEYNKGITEIIEEVTKEIPVYENSKLTPEDILKIWNDTTGNIENRDLYDYIAGASSATKRSIVAKALKGIVEESLQGRFGKKVSTKTITEKIKRVIYPKEISTANIRQRFRELLKDEINRRRLFDLITIKDELKALTQWWNPFNEKTDADYTKYRYSGKELYAEAMSVLLNMPKELADRAPWFNRAFFNHLETKPEVKDAYEGLQQLIKDPVKVFEERSQRAKEGYIAAREKILAETEKNNKSFTVDNFVRTFVSEISPLIKKFPNSARYGELSPRQSVRNVVEQMKFINNKYAEIIYKVKDDVLQPIADIGIDADEFGTLLEFGRNISKSKIEKPAPGGMQATHSIKQIEYIKNKYTPEQQVIIENALSKFHNIVWDVIDDAYKAELYSKDYMDKTLIPNKDTYAMFQAVKYATNYVSARDHQLKGSLSQIRNPLESTMAKLFAISNATYRSRAAKSIVESLREFTPEEISEAKPDIRNGVAIGQFQPIRNKYALGFYEKGAYKGVYVDKYFESIFKNSTPQEIDFLTNIFRNFNKGFKPLVTSWNPGFAFLFNVIKDSRRTVTNLYANSAKRAIDPATWAEVRWKMLKGFAGATKEGADLYEGHMSEVIKEMMDAGVFDYRTGILSRYNEGNSESIDVIASRIGMGNSMMSPVETKIAKNKVARELNKIVNWYFKWGSALEIGTKVNAYKLLKEKGYTKDAAAFTVRNYVGTPNYKEGGRISKNMNEYLPFSTVIIQGLRNDFSLATKPSTAGAYWFDMVMGAALPATAMALAGAGLFGDETKKLIQNIPVYYRYNYLSIPLGKSETGKTQYLSIPMDEVGRLIYAVTYGITKAIAEQETPTLKEAQQIGQIGIGFVPSMSPLANIIGAWNDYLIKGKNPSDDFRGSNVIKTKNFNAGGWPATKDMLSWSISRAGGSGMMSLFSFDPVENTTQEFAVKNIPIISRIYRESSAGDGEIFRQINEQEKQKSGKRISEQDIAIDNTVKKYFNDHEKESTTGRLKFNEYSKQMASEYFGYYPVRNSKELAEYQKMNQKLKLKLAGGIKGDHQQVVNAVINSYNTDATVAMLKKYKETHSDAEYGAVAKYLLLNKIVSNKVLHMVD